MKRGIRELLSRTDFGFRYFLRRDFGVGQPTGKPEVSWANQALRTRREWVEACEQARRLGLPSHPTPAKNWDSLVALDQILRHVNPSARILDAGALLNSMILPWLFLYGYENLFGVNLDFPAPIRRGPIRYSPGDLTRTDFPSGHFRAITCLSVVEHGVDWSAYFREMSRLLEPGGLLITSTDYFESPVDTRGQSAFGAPLKIFSRKEIEDAFGIAESHSLRPLGPMDFHCEEKAVRWEEFDLDYTFLNFVLGKSA